MFYNTRTVSHLTGVTIYIWEPVNPKTEKKINKKNNFLLFPPVNKNWNAFLFSSEPYRLPPPISEDNQIWMSLKWFRDSVICIWAFLLYILGSASGVSLFSYLKNDGEREERKASIVRGNIIQLQENGYTEDESEMKLLCECILPWCYPNIVPSSQREGCCAFYWKLWQFHGALPEKKKLKFKEKTDDDGCFHKDI